MRFRNIINLKTLNGLAWFFIWRIHLWLSYRGAGILNWESGDFSVSQRTGEEVCRSLPLLPMNTMDWLSVRQTQRGTEPCVTSPVPTLHTLAELPASLISATQFLSGDKQKTRRSDKRNHIAGHESRVFIKRLEDSELHLTEQQYKIFGL